jgi:hypothetical protein
MSATQSWKVLEESYNFASEFTPIGGWSREIWAPKVLGFQSETVTTLALGLRPRLRGCKVAGQDEGSPGVKAKALQGCGPRGSRGVTSHILGSVRKCEGVWGSEHSHSQGNCHFGRWSPIGLPKLQRAISRVKPQYLVTFFISLESS